MSYTEYKINLSQGQLDSIRKAKGNKENVTIRLSNSDLTGSNTVYLTQRQINKIQKAKSAGTGVEIDFSTTQIKKQSGGALPLAAMATSMAPAIPNALSSMTSSIANASNAAAQRGFDKNVLTGKYDRKRERNERAVQRKDDKQLAKRFNYVKKEFVKERGLNWDDAKIWEYVMSGGDLKMDNYPAMRPSDLQSNVITPGDPKAPGVIRGDGMKKGKLIDAYKMRKLHPVERKTIKDIGRQDNPAKTGQGMFPHGSGMFPHGSGLFPHGVRGRGLRGKGMDEENERLRKLEEENKRLYEDSKTKVRHGCTCEYDEICKCIKKNNKSSSRVKKSKSKKTKSKKKVQKK